MAFGKESLRRERGQCVYTRGERRQRTPDGKAGSDPDGPRLRCCRVWVLR